MADCGDVEKKNDTRKVALITGITGQDGSYLAELLLDKGYEVHGIIRRASTFNTHRIEHLYEHTTTHSGGTKFKLHYGDMTDSSCLVKIISEVKPSEIYNLAAQSHVKVSFELSEYTANVDAVGTLRLLDAIRTCGLTKSVRFYQASTSEMFGKVQEVPQTEMTPFYPRSPYGVAKLYAYWIVRNYREAYDMFACNGILFNHESPRRGVAKLYSYWIIKNYREAYGMFACNGILFNHESPRRGETFVTRKITRAVAKIFLGQQEILELGNIDAERDWGHAKDYVEAMWMMLQTEEPDDFVISTGETHKVRKFLVAAFKEVGIDIVWEGSGLDEVGKDKATGKVRVRINPRYYRPTEVDTLLGDCSKAKAQLGWLPKYNFDMLVKEMVQADLALMKANPQA